jgi:hypothetical protein
MGAITIDTPGYCYLVLFKKERRAEAFKLLGAYPKARDVMFHQPLMHAQWRSHLITTDARGIAHVHKEGGFKSLEHGARRQKWLVTGRFLMGAQYPLGPVNPVITSFILLTVWRFLYLVLTPIIPLYMNEPGSSQHAQDDEEDEDETRIGQIEFTRLEGGLTQIKWLSSNFEKIFRDDDPLIRDLMEQIQRTGNHTGTISTGLSIDGPNVGKTGWKQWFWLAWRQLMVYLQRMAFWQEKATEQLKKLADAQERIAKKAERVTIDKPEPFDGDKNKMKQFLKNLDYYFLVNEITDDKKKVLVAISLVKGGKNDVATEWSNNAREYITKHCQTKWKMTYEYFKTRLTDVFGSKADEEHFRMEIRKMKQDKLSAEEFNMNFNIIYDKCGYDTPEMVSLDYQQALKRPLLDKILQGGKPETIGEWQSRAVEEDNKWRYAQELGNIYHGERQSSDKGKGKAQGQNQNNAGQKKTNFFVPRPQNTVINNTPAFPAPDPNAMDVDRTRIRNERKAQGACYKCGLKGHMIANCPQRQVRQVNTDETETSSSNTSQAPMNNNIGALPDNFATMTNEEKGAWFNARVQGFH